MMPAPRRLILASGSKTRQTLLAAAGVSFDVKLSDVDEAEIRESMLADSVSHEEIAQALADAKASDVSARDRDALVIGADQVLSCDGRFFEKAPTMKAARACLSDLRGKTHVLHSATALAVGGDIVWRDVRSARLTLRSFTDEALDAYLAQAGDVVLTSVGAYQIEGPAIQLFETIEGEHSTILGLPLLPLLAELRRCEILAS